MKLLARFLFGWISVALFSASAFAGQFSGFEQYVDQGSLKPFARDLGGMLGSGTFHSGRALGLSGWDIGARGVVQFQPDKNDTILRNNGVHAFGMPWAQAEVGLPWGIDGFVRGISYQGLTIAGGGLRYELLPANDKPWAPQLLVSGVAHSVVFQSFSASHFGASLVGSMGTQKFTPYVGAGFDRTRVSAVGTATDNYFSGSATTFESRFTAGMQYRPWTFAYVHVAYVLAHLKSGAEAGLGIRF